MRLELLEDTPGEVNARPYLLWAKGAPPTRGNTTRSHRASWQNPPEWTCTGWISLVKTFAKTGHHAGHRLVNPHPSSSARHRSPANSPSSSVFFTETGTNRSHKATALIPYCFYGKSAGPFSLHSNGPILLWMGLSYVLVPVFGQGAAIRSPQQRFHVGELPRPKNRSREATRTP